ncbi:MAG: hypothetical protein OEW19_02755 [Acidobacteriota bacterium]|nr:hypothetical protein [Acidobacteriota bacterium]
MRSALTQTAAWVGDPIDFVVEIETAPGVEVVAEDLTPEKLVIEGLELGPATSTSDLRADGWNVLRRQYRVTAWDTTPPKSIGELVVRFRRPVTTATADGSAPGAEVKVPGATLAVRSTLPDDGSANGARDQLAQAAPPTWIEWLRPTGLGFIVLGIAPVVLWVAASARRPRVVRTRPSTRTLHAHVKSLFDELAIIDTSTADGRQRAYNRMDADVRAYLIESEGVPAAALTADELRPRLAESRRVQGDALCDVLAECEHARYAPPERLPGTDAVGASIARLRDALGQHA